MRGPRARAPSEKGGYGGRFAASMTLEILHGALVLLGRRPRLERAEITAAAGFLVDFARIEAIAARPELADHRRRPRAACARRMLRFAARLFALVAIVGLRRWFRRWSTARNGQKFRLSRGTRRRTPGAGSAVRAASGESPPMKEPVAAPSPPAPNRGCHPRPAEIRDRGSR